jgi:hypothetical protein
MDLPLGKVPLIGRVDIIPLSVLRSLSGLADAILQPWS